jgi:hypothetical protein
MCNIDSFNQGFYVKISKIKSCDYWGFSIRTHPVGCTEGCFACALYIHCTLNLGYDRAVHFSTEGLRLNIVRRRIYVHTPPYIIF